jgi:hypothetical protein
MAPLQLSTDRHSHQRSADGVTLLQIQLADGLDIKIYVHG